MSMLIAGVDAGSWAVKAVVLDDLPSVRGAHVSRTGLELVSAVDEALAGALSQAGVARAALSFMMATGYGRKMVPGADADMTEISALAVGCHWEFPWPVTVVDVGGQDCKVVRLDEAGRILQFKMNRKCAAGTGAFLEECARRLGSGESLTRLSEMARRSKNAVELGSFCTVFTQTEMLDLIRRGTAADDLARGLFLSVAKRVQEMDPLEGEVVLTGGVAAHQPALGEVMAERLRGPISLPSRPQLVGAVGAALAGLDRLRKHDLHR